jgi:enoyl-CoA hydratase/carnithine racemase
MDEIITEYSESVLRVALNRPTKRNAMTSSMYVALAEILNEAAKDVLWRGAGDGFWPGNDVEDLLKNPPGPGESPQARLMNALIDFYKPLGSVSAGIGHVRAAELILLGLSFDAKRAAEPESVT